MRHEADVRPEARLINPPHAQATLLQCADVPLTKVIVTWCGMGWFKSSASFLIFSFGSKLLFWSFVWRLFCLLGPEIKIFSIKSDLVPWSMNKSEKCPELLQLISCQPCLILLWFWLSHFISYLQLFFFRLTVQEWKKLIVQKLTSFSMWSRLSDGHV